MSGSVDVEPKLVHTEVFYRGKDRRRLLINVYRFSDRDLTVIYDEVEDRVVYERETPIMPVLDHVVEAYRQINEDYDEVAWRAEMISRFKAVFSLSEFLTLDYENHN
ncbi:MAG: hypothetical protein ACP5HP_04235 [Thermogladius sp.]